jgi:hypothetical protein
MEKFEYKVLKNKVHGVLKEDWFDGEENVGPEMTSELLSRFGEQGWEVVGTMQYISGPTYKIIMKRRLAS